METLMTVAAIGVVLLTYTITQYFKPHKDIQSFPVVPFLMSVKSAILGQSYDEQFDQIYRPVLEKLGYARCWTHGGWDVLVSNPEQVKEILSDSNTFLKRSPAEENNDKRLLFSKFLGPKNLAVVDGHEWRRHRRSVNPALKKSWDTELFAGCIKDLIEKFDEFNQEPVEIYPLFQRLTLDVLGQILFGYNFEAVKKGKDSFYLNVYNDVMSAIFSPIYFLVPFLEGVIPSRKYYHERAAAFRNFITDLIKERKADLEDGIDRTDLLSSIIKASREETDEAMKLSDEEVLDDVNGFFMAGHDTTANTLTASFYFLAKHRDIQEKARQAIIDVLGDNGAVVTPTKENLKDIPYLDCFIKESMRSMSTVAQLRRYCTTTTSFGNGLIVPGGSFVSVDLWSVHHDPNVYPDPSTFNPDRFIDPLGPQGRAWMPFGFGSRMCAGSNFSLLEQRVVMAMILQRYTVHLGPKCGSLEKPFLKQSILTYPLDIDLQFVPR